MGQVPEKANGEKIFSQTDWNVISEEFSIMDAINNEFAVRIAQNEFENNISKLNYDGGFFITYVNKNKISSNSNISVTTGTKGKISLQKTYNLIEGLEDGNTTNWTGDTGSFTAQTGTVISGTYSGELNAYDDQKKVTYEGISTSKNVEISVQAPYTLGGNDFILVGVMGDTGNFYTYCELKLRQDGKVIVRGNDTGETWSGGETHKVRFEPDFNNNETDVYFNNVLVAENVDFDPNDNVSGTTEGVRFTNDTFDSGADYNAYIDDIQEPQGFVSSGNITTVEFDLSNELSEAPNTVVLSDTRQLPDDATIEYLLEDSDGKTKTLTESDVDTEVDVSNFTSAKVTCKITLYASSDQSSAPTQEDIAAHFKV